MSHGEDRLMGMLGWVMMGLALWHFTIFLPDRFYGGIVGAFVGSLIGAIDRRPADLRDRRFRLRRSRAVRQTTIGVVLYAVPGALLGIAVAYALGIVARAASA